MLRATRLFAIFTLLFGTGSQLSAEEPTDKLIAANTTAANRSKLPLAPAADITKPRGLGDPGRLESISIEQVSGGASLKLVGPDASLQLIVTGHYSSGQLRDLTHTAKYSTAATPELVDISTTGWVSPLGEGTATVQVSHAGQTTEATIEVAGLVDPAAVNFQNQVVPVFTKLGCNSGGCHGKAGGQNGFQLSLLGFEPQEDYEHLLKESRGRRLFPAAPERSLLVQKASGIVPHSGGARLAVDSPAYRTMVRWIAEGAVFAGEEEPTITHVEVVPSRRILDLESEQQLSVIAHYSDGTNQDVTRLAQFESANRDLASVDEQGLVKTTHLPGKGAVMARYQSQVAVFQATLPLGAAAEEMPAANNFIDELVFQQLKELGLPPSELCSDHEFLRRVTIDIAGRLPSQEETRKFVADTDPEKRTKWVDTLLASGDYADYFANKWSALLRNRGDEETSGRTTYALHAWIRKSFLENKPYDKFVTEILTASGAAGRDPTVTWYHQVKKQDDIVEDAAQIFLGQRIQCARCHHHPFEKWSQRDYYGMAAFFSRIGRKPSRAEPGQSNIFHRPGNASAVNPRSGESVKPTGLGGEEFEIDQDDDPRMQLAAWMTAQDNPFFAHSLVNRYWKHFLGRGLVEPEDDLRVTNPPTNPDLLSAMAKHFSHGGYDLKDLIRTICTSKVYQLSAVPNAFNQNDKQSYSRFYPRRLSAEVLSDAIDVVTDSATKFEGTLAGTRAVQLPEFQTDSYFLTVFGRPEGNSACECERSGDATLAQSLHLLNSDEILKKVGEGILRAADSKKQSHEQRVRKLYMAAYSRQPTKDELAAAVEYIEARPKDTRVAYEDLITVILNTKEFLFNH